MVEGRLITVLNKGVDFAVSIDQVREVIPAGDIFPVPGSTWPFVGLMIYRQENVLPVFSLEGLLGGAEAVSGNLLLVFQRQGAVCGFPVDRIGGLIRDLSDDQFQGYEGTLQGPSEAIRGVVEEGGRQFLVIDLDKIFMV